MREKELRAIITFHTTAEAIAAERCCRAAGLEGRLIPTPRKLSAGCGIAWSAPPEKGADIIGLLDEKKIAYADICKIPV